MILINPQIPQIDRLTPKFGFKLIYNNKYQFLRGVSKWEGVL